MVRLYVLQTGQTIWADQQRMESAAGVPLSERGAQDVAEAARQLAECKIATIYAPDGEAEKQAAQLAAGMLGVKVKTHRNLHELDFGLWQGLTVDELKRRQPKMYRQWTQAPVSVRPPGGETLEEARQRLGAAVKEIVKRQKAGPVLLVLRPVARGLLRCLVAGAATEAIWQHVDPHATWDRFEVDVEKL